MLTEASRNKRRGAKCIYNVGRIKTGDTTKITKLGDKFVLLIFPCNQLKQGQVGEIIIQKLTRCKYPGGSHVYGPVDSQQNYVADRLVHSEIINSE